MRRSMLLHLSSRLILAIAAVLLLAGCGEDAKLRAAVDDALPSRATAGDCSSEGGLVDYRAYLCRYELDANRVEATLAVASRLRKAGYRVTCGEGSDDGIDVDSFRGDVSVFAHVIPRNGGAVKLEFYAKQATPLARDLVNRGSGCAPLRVAHIGTLPCLSGWNENPRATALARRLAVRPKALVRGFVDHGCTFLFRTHGGFVVAFGTWSGRRLVLSAHRSLFEWERNERRAYARNAAVLVRTDGTLAGRSA